MSNRTLNLSDDLYNYMLDVSLRENFILKKLREETSTLSAARMQISPEQGQFMALLVNILGARQILEIGVFTGYSSLCMALANEDVTIVACDLSKDWTDIAKRYWKEAGVDSRIQLYLQGALITLDKLQKEDVSFDLAFIDADKENYIAYYEKSLSLLRKGGVILIDNVLWGGAVIDPKQHDADTLSIRTLNKLIKDDPRVEISLLPIGDGLTLARKK